MAEDIIVGAVAVFFLGMGVLGLVAPAALVRPFGIELRAPEAVSEIRAVYGGFGVAMAALLGAAVFDVGGIRTGAVVAVAAALAGMALGRVVSRLAGTRTGGCPNWFYCGVEVVAAALLIMTI
ncbi:DUF4345 family protein [Amycolatopsis samaneae]|uniref:DUF4345 family protein n=1 Tax=Amycolatopsis samaneae TaxID=664691 RepID=A0ABW5GGW1_9PSEU